MKDTTSAQNLHFKQEEKFSKETVDLAARLSVLKKIAQVTRKPLRTEVKEGTYCQWAETAGVTCISECQIVKKFNMNRDFFFFLKVGGREVGFDTVRTSL